MNKRYSDEFKAEALRLSDSRETTVRDVARDLGINFRTLEHWRHLRRQSRTRTSPAAKPLVPGPTMADLERENQRLKRQMEVLRQERDILKSHGHFRRLARQGCGAISEEHRFRWIDEHRTEYPITRMCCVLAVSRSGYYAWRDRPPSQCSMANERLLESIRQIHQDARQVYGAPRIHAELRARTERCGRHRVARLMRAAGLCARQYRRTRRSTTSRHQLPVAENLLRQDFHAQAANQKWVADITYIWTAEGWLYLAVVIDLFSRRVVGWSMQQMMSADLVIDAQRIAFDTRRPAPGLLQHSDRGSQYASEAYQRLLRQRSSIGSMSSRGNCYDNAAMESFFHTLKVELVHHCRWQTRQEARQAIFEYIEVFYNRQRRHSTLSYLSPVEFEATASHDAADCPP